MDLTPRRQAEGASSTLEFVNMSIAQLEQKAQEVEARAAALSAARTRPRGDPPAKQLVGVGRAWESPAVGQPLRVEANHRGALTPPRERGGREYSAVSPRHEPYGAHAEDTMSRLTERRAVRANRRRQYDDDHGEGGWEPQQEGREVLQDRLSSALRQVDGLSGRIAELQSQPQTQWPVAPPVLPVSAFHPAYHQHGGYDTGRYADLAGFAVSSPSVASTAPRRNSPLRAPRTAGRTGDAVAKAALLLEQLDQLDDGSADQLEERTAELRDAEAVQTQLIHRWGCPALLRLSTSKLAVYCARN
jgi:hypothetical protein